MKPPSSPAPSAWSLCRASSSAGPVGPARLRARCASISASPARRGHVDADLVAARPRNPPSSWRKAIRPREARSSMAVVRARREVAAVHDHRARGGRQVRRRGGHQHRRIVEVDRVLAEPPPVPERPAGQAHEHDRRTDQAEDRVDLARPLELGRVRRRRGGVDPLESHGQRGVEVGVLEVGEHVVVEDRLALLVREEGGLEAGRRVQLDLTVLQVRLHVEEDDHPVVEAGPPDAPLVDQGARLGFGLLGRRVGPAVLGVDDDLGRRPGLDRIDRGLGLDDRLR